MWPTAFNFLLAILIFAFNLLLLAAVAMNKRLQTPTLMLSVNLWACNCISAIVTIFFNLTHTAVRLENTHTDDIIKFDVRLQRSEFLHSTHPAASDLSPSSLTALTSSIASPPLGPSMLPTPPPPAVPSAIVASFPSSPIRDDVFSAHFTAVLFNSTVSLLSLLTIGFMHALLRHNYHLSSHQAARLLQGTWLLISFLLCADFFLAHTSHHTTVHSLLIPFHLALLSVFLCLNLIIHPLNLVLLTKCRRVQQPDRERAALLDDCVTSSLWVLLNALSFIIIAMMVVWSSHGGKDTLIHLLGIEMAAFHVHCLANPLIAVIRNRQLEAAIVSMVCSSKRQTTLDDELVVALMRDPPPPYST